MQPPLAHKILDQQLWLTSDRTMFWEEEKSLIVSDLHFGKTGHFRKAGIPVPAFVYKEDLQRLVAQIQHFQPRQLIIVGDMFHSHANKELELFLKWRDDLAGVDMHLVRGNHDILKQEWYVKAGITISPSLLSMNRFRFVHDISDPTVSFEEETASGPAPYFFSGHLHPGIRRPSVQTNAHVGEPAQRRTRLGAKKERRRARGGADPRRRARLLLGAQVPELRQLGAPRRGLAKRQISL